MPWAARALAVAAPIPWLAPVTSATRDSGEDPVVIVLRRPPVLVPAERPGAYTARSPSGCSAQRGEAVEDHVRFGHEAPDELARGHELGDGAHALARRVALPVDVDALAEGVTPRCMAPSP